MWWSPDFIKKKTGWKKEADSLSAVLPKQFRLQDYQQIEKVKKEGKLYQSPLFGVLILPRNDRQDSRFAIITSLKISKKATQRNRTKRLLSEAIRSLLPEIRDGFDLVFLAKKTIIGKSFWEIKSQSQIVFKKAELTK